jgi:hypothetical protein
MNPDCTPAIRTTRSLLGYGIIAGPIYVAVALAQALTRPGFDLRRHAWSLLADGHLGWIQVANFVVTGFPTGTARSSTPVSWHGMLHLALGGTGFLCLIAACLVLARRFARDGRYGLAWFSRGAAVFFLAAFAGTASGSHGPTTVVFAAAVVTVFAWLSSVSVTLYRTATA